MDIITDLDGRLRDTDGGIREQDIGLIVYKNNFISPTV